MGRYLAWSLCLHIVVVAGWLALAPLGGILGHRYRPAQVISVGLVDFPRPAEAAPVAVPEPPVPVPAEDAAIPVTPERDLTPERVAEKQQFLRRSEADTSRKKRDTLNARKSGGPALARADTVSNVSHAIRERSAAGDVWGVETSPNVNPYHRRGFASIRSNWRNPLVGPVGRKCVVRFRVLRTGEITGITLEKSSGLQLFDQAALRAVRQTGSWQPFPAFWEEDEQVIHLEFEYRPE